jgi:hypothetical protein
MHGGAYGEQSVTSLVRPYRQEPGSPTAESALAAVRRFRRL